MKFLFRIWLVLMILAMVVSSCSRKKNSFTRRAYHNTTSHYNYYFNAREILRAYEENIRESHVDDYNYLLPIFIYGTDEQSSAAYDDMEEIIKKCSRLIDRHSMFLRKEEHNKWVDRSYLLVGQARFHKKEYYGAIEVFEYMDIVYKGNPSYYKANMWMARCYLEMEDYRETYSLLSDIKEGELPESLKGEYFAIWADYSIKSGEKEYAAPYLRDAVKYAADKDKKRRYTYILAQLYHQKHDYANATKYYGQVLKMRPDYRMSFNAKLNQARSYDVSANNSKKIKKRLNRMLRDRKNLEFRDQIYFAMAEMAFREKNEELGMEYLKKSAQTSVNNNKVKAEAYMLLGDIFFDKPKYIPAHAYYDSCMTILPERHPEYEKTEERLESLDDLVKSLLTIQREDSLQKIAAMDEKSRNKLIDGIIDEVKQKEELLKQQRQQGFALSYTSASSSGSGIGSWYFYNQSVKSFGIAEFESLWGTRTYEDNWRRSIRQTEIEFSEGDSLVENIDSTEIGLTNKDPEFYLKDLPMTDSSLRASHWQIILALYDAGNIFREDFVDYHNAIKCFERLVQDYDTSRYVESCYYQLFRIYLLLEDSEQANHYRNKILNDYPFSEYARIIKNPEYLKNKRDQREQVEAYYKATYQLYDYGLYRDVIDACEKSDTIFGNHHLKPKFAYLKSLCVGKIGTKSEFKQALEEVIAKHPTEDVSTSAQKIIDKINNIEQEQAKIEELYKKNFRDEHVFVVMVPNQSKIVENVKISVSNFNLSNKVFGELQVSSVVFSAEQQMISVKSFKDKENGMRYVESIRQYPEFQAEVEKNGYESFLISMENFAYFFQKKNVNDYLTFYANYYVK